MYLTIPTTYAMSHPRSFVLIFFNTVVLNCIALKAISKNYCKVSASAVAPYEFGSSVDQRMIGDKVQALQEQHSKNMIIPIMLQFEVTLHTICCSY